MVDSTNAEPEPVEVVTPVPPRNTAKTPVVILAAVNAVKAVPTPTNDVEDNAPVLALYNNAPSVSGASSPGVPPTSTTFVDVDAVSATVIVVATFAVNASTASVAFVARRAGSSTWWRSRARPGHSVGGAQPVVCGQAVGDLRIFAAGRGAGLARRLCLGGV